MMNEHLTNWSRFFAEEEQEDIPDDVAELKKYIKKILNDQKEDSHKWTAIDQDELNKRAKALLEQKLIEIREKHKRKNLEERLQKQDRIKILMG